MKIKENKKKVKKKENKKISKYKRFIKTYIKNKKRYKIFILIIFTIFLYFPIIHNNNYKILNEYVEDDTKEYINNDIDNDIKACICTLGKKENRYIREYVSYYEKYGIDKIYLYDNNDING